jgi:hypothetical protein
LNSSKKEENKTSKKQVMARCVERGWRLRFSLLEVALEVPSVVVLTLGEGGLANVQKETRDALCHTLLQLLELESLLVASNGEE